MGPLVPFIISNEFNLIIALIAGIGFGFVLEQAGFSSTKKLVGLFYGYDFTVLKVFFTAGITAMIGVLLLAHWGLLDLSLIYINPTFLWSALLGGAIMGVGFIIGGFCPGTSICAASIGKLDGLAFVFGGGLGVIVFAEGYPLVKNIYLSEAWGGVLMNEMLGMSKIMFAVLLTALAFIAFYLTGLVENRVNGIPTALNTKKKVIYSSTIGFAFLVLAVIVFSPDSKNRMEARINKTVIQKDFTSASVPADQLASEIVNNYYRINIIDVRDTAAFRAYHLPFAINIPYEKMADRQWGKVLDQKHKVNYFYADDKQVAAKAYLLAGYLGNAENYILNGSAVNFRKLFSNLTPPGVEANKSEIDTYNFRQKAATDMKMLVDALKNSSEPVIAKTTKIKGGC